MSKSNLLIASQTQASEDDDYDESQEVEEWWTCGDCKRRYFAKLSESCPYCPVASNIHTQRIYQLGNNVSKSLLEVLLKD